MRDWLPAWDTYLIRLGSDSSTIPPGLAVKARALWEALELTSTEPQAGPVEDGGFYFVFDKAQNHLEIEIDVDEPGYFWFFRDRQSDLCEGGNTLSLEDLLESVRPYLVFFR